MLNPIVRCFGEARADCDRCPLHETSAVVGLPFRYVQEPENPKGTIALVFSAPANADIDSGAVASDRYGKLVLAAAARWFPEYVVAAGLAVRCHPGFAGTGRKTKPPPAAALKGCHRWLAHDLSALDDLKLIIPVGEHAIAAVLRQTLKDSKPMKMAGQAYSTEWGCPAVPVQTPQWALFDPASNGTVWDRAWEEAAAIAAEKPGQFKEHEWHLYGTQAEAEAFHRRLMEESNRQHAVIAYDYETYGLDLYDDEGNDLRMVGYTWDGEVGHVVPLSRQVQWTVDLHREWLRTPCTKIYHNGLFEHEAALLMLQAQPEGPTVDTKLLSYLDNENRSVSLDNLTAEFLPDLYGFKKETEREARDNGWADMPFVPLAKRNAHDVIATHKLAHLVRQRLRPDTATLYRQVVDPAVGTLARMKVRGWKVNRALAKVKKERFKAEYKRLEAEMRDLEDVKLWAKRSNLSVDEVKFTSRTDHLPRLLDACGIDTGEQQENGLMATGAKLLKPHAGKHPIVPLLMEYHKQKDLHDKFAVPLLRWSERDGYIHPGYNLGGKVNMRDADGTVTLRLSSRNPNVMNYPEEILPCFVSRFPGGGILARDFDQLELRVMTVASGDAVLMDTFAKGGDPHQATADAISAVLKQPVGRPIGKLLNFAIAYGGGVQRIMLELGCSEAMAEQLLNAFWEAHPELRRMFAKWRLAASTKGVIPGLFGQDLHVPDALDPDYRVRSHAFRRSGNFPIQNGGAVLTLGAMYWADKLLMERGMQSILIAQLHDALYVDHAPGEADEVSAILVEAMEQRPARLYPWFNVPLTTDEKRGRTMAGDTLRIKS